mmetsp:Transcript_37096/g.54531  ORF Transcript_37096/g.54531 Transcript_37096/m.54531 type:complete len:118 (-) Transcript_37096:71-424(-)|eukprot:CAMPEP_0195523286 /NCGR_PEP_ID=MMETSP0794_2-20130614/22276_1 /TAXON_ID=515487 /ORGANISM="Stephanopyxis turris, Strain CCMP 815" /LENGTH=117 /DNA_ID=CAMNT_0040653247 /DNA_START=115 /DNA_END=468 /DNA_ORIENTATION=-
MSAKSTPAKGKKGKGTGSSPTKRKALVGPALAEKAKFSKPPYIQAWDAFEREAKRLYQRNPNNTRLFSKYRAPDEFLELKVTDDVKCVKYLMTAQADMYNLEKLNLWFMEQAMGKKA